MNTSIKSINETNEKLCYVMDLKKEYGPNKVGKENYALITDMSETELKETYGDALKQYEPYVMMTLEMGEVIFESHRNDWKHLKRQVKYGCDYSVSDEEFDEHHPECAEIPDYLTYIATDEKYVQLHSAIKMLSPIQRERINKYYFEQMSPKEIAGEENVSVQAIRKSLEKGLTTLKELLENEQLLVTRNKENRIMENKANKSVQWGDIFFCNLGKTKGSVQSGIRPVIVVQTNRLNQKSPTVVVAVLTTVIKKAEMNTHILLGIEYGLPEPSMIMLEQLRTVDVDNELIEYVGTVTNENKINEIKRGLRYAIGIPLKPKAERKAVILSLCPTCRKEFFDAKDYFIKRLDLFQTEKECCEKCQVGYGYDYLISKKYNRKEQKNYGEQND